MSGVATVYCGQNLWGESGISKEMQFVLRKYLGRNDTVAKVEGKKIKWQISMG